MTHPLQLGLGLSPIAIGVIVAIVLLIVIAGTIVYRRRSESDYDPIHDPDTVIEGDEDDDVAISLPAPDISTSSFGLLRAWRYHKKRQKFAKKGYIQWYLIDDTFPKPRFVKPKERGGGIPELKHKGERYLFPRDASLASEQQGMWTYIHKKGEADPLNLRDPTRHAIPTDELEEYLSLRVSSSPPSWFSKFDVSAQDVLRWGVIGIIVIALLNGLLSGGIM